VYRTLIPLDSSERRAAAQAEAVAALPDVENSVTAILVHVFERRTGTEPPPVTQLSSGGLVHDVLTEAGVDVETATRRGDPASEILEVARERDVDSIVIGGRKRSSLGKILFGSVTQAVLKRTNRPVTVTGVVGETGDANASDAVVDA
jgi:nucleotide-binding universal stress UspA family protein